MENDSDVYNIILVPNTSLVILRLSVHSIVMKQ